MLKWEELYHFWRASAHEYPEINDLTTFAAISWPGGSYWMPARPTEVSDLTGSVWVDWWPRAEMATRSEDLMKRTSYGTWRSAFPLLPEACRHTLRYIWAAQHDPQAVAAVWLAATMIMWNSSREERQGWAGPTYRMCQYIRHLCWGRMENHQIGTWLHSCKYPLPESIDRFIRPPMSVYDLVEMAAANAAFIHNRWALVRLYDDEASEATQPLA